jgi:hypothetical protein
VDARLGGRAACNGSRPRADKVLRLDSEAMFACLLSLPPLRVILKGSQSAATPGQPRDFSMPAFAVLTNKKLAHLATYLRNSWGNRASPVSVSIVKQTRNMLKPRD